MLNTQKLSMNCKFGMNNDKVDRRYLIHHHNEMADMDKNYSTSIAQYRNLCILLVKINCNSDIYSCMLSICCL